MKKSILYKMVFSFSVIMIITLLITTFFVYYISETTINKQISQIDLNILSKSSAIVDTITEDLEKNIIQVTLNTYFQQYMNIQDNSITPFFIDSLYPALNLLFTVKQSNKYIKNIYVCNFHLNTIISSERLYEFIEPETHIKQLPVNKWVKITEGNNLFEDLEGSMKNPNIVYVKNIPLFNPNPYGSIIIELDISMLENIIIKNIGLENSDIMLFDSNMTSITSTRKQEEHFLSGEVIDKITSGTELGFFTYTGDAGEYAVSFYTSEKNGWKYVKMTLMSEYMSSINRIRFIVICITFLMVAISMLFIMKASLHISKPIKTLIEHVAFMEQGKIIATRKKYDIQLLADTFQRIHQERNKIQKVLWNNYELIKNAYLMNLMTNRLDIEPYYSTSILELSDINFKADKPYFFVFLISIDNFNNFISSYSQNDQELYIFSIINICEGLAKNYNNICMGCKLTSGSIGLLINTKNNSQENIIMFAEDIKKNVVCFDLSVTIAISNRYKEINNTNIAYTQVVSAMDHRFLLGHGAIIPWSETFDFSDDKTSSMPEIDINKILNSFKKDNIETTMSIACNICKGIKNQKITDRSLVYAWFIELVKRVEYNIYSSYQVQFSFYSNVDELYNSIITIETIDDFSVLIKENLAKAWKFLNEKETDNYYIQKAIDYMNKNYAKDISLELIASYVGFNPSYFSTLFKNETGVNFIYYLNKIRIGKAKELFLKKNETVNNVSRQVGFSTAASFIRTFKKFEGITPGLYKENLSYTHTDISYID